MNARQLPADVDITFDRPVRRRLPMRFPAVEVSATAGADDLPREVCEEVAAYVEQALRERADGALRTLARRLALSLAPRSTRRPRRRVELPNPDSEATFQLTTPVLVSRGGGGIVLSPAFLAWINSKTKPVLTAAGTPSTPVCVCAAHGGPGGAVYRGKTIEDLGPPDPARAYWYFAIRVKTIFGGVSDTIRMQIPHATTLPADRTEIVLRVDDTWAKEVYAWSVCRNRTLSVTHPGDYSPEVVLPLTRAQCEAGDADTIAFAKPGFLGLWTDVFHWQIGTFWPMHAGRRVMYTWLQ
jgi:hypothetical protein